MKLHTMVPFRTDANLGLAYNEAMACVGPGEWAVMLDHDAAFTTKRWHAQIEEAIAFMPDAGAFVSMTNRIASAWQRCGDPNSNDMAWHRRFGAERAANVRTLLDVTNTKGWGGVCFAISKEAWLAAGGFANGLGCVDHSIHFRLQAIGRRIWLIEGLYLYHWRHWGERDTTELHPKAVNCPCRGPEKMPTHRVSLDG